jgi:hypothetical protein
VYLTRNGRISMAGVTSKNVDYLAHAMHKVREAFHVLCCVWVSLHTFCCFSLLIGLAGHGLNVCPMEIKEANARLYFFSFSLSLFFFSFQSGYASGNGCGGDASGSRALKKA